MARTGTFGRAPRAQPSLTNTLLAIAREQQNTQDRNLMEAWYKGGMFEGHKVTDDFMLKYWRARVNGVSKDDPLYDTYKNAVTQFEYTIAESKMTAKYAQIVEPTAGDDANMAQFYMKWSKKIPKDSEFYRVLMRDAGQYMRSAAAKRKAAAATSTTDAYNARQLALQKRYETAGQKALDFITMLAQEGAGGRDAILGQTTHGDFRTSASATNIGDLNITDIDTFNGLLAQVMVSPDATEVSERGARGLDIPEPTGNPAILFYDSNDRPVRGTDIVQALKNADPSFDGNFNLDALHSFVGMQKEGLRKRIALARKTGHYSEVQSLKLELDRVDEFDEQIQATPVLARYADLATEKQAIIADTSMSPAAKAHALEQVNGRIGALADDPSIKTDGHLQSQLRGEAEGVAGTVPVSIDMQGFDSMGTVPPNDPRSVEFANAAYEIAVEQVELAAQPGWVMTQGVYDSTGFHPRPGGPALGAADQKTVDSQYNGGAGSAVTVMIPDGMGGLTPIRAVPSPITVSGTMPDGQPITTDRSTPAGSYIQYTLPGGQKQTLYKITDRETGVARWSPEAPVDFSNGITQRATKDGTITWDFTGYFSAIPPAAFAAAKTDQEVVPGSGVYLRGSGAKAKIQLDGEAAAWFTVPERTWAGFDANTDAYSPTLAGIIATADGPALVAKYKNDPAFRAQIDTDNRIAAGFQPLFDPSTGSVIGWDETTGNPALYGELGARANTAIQEALPGHSVGGSWDKTGTATTPAGASVAPATTPLPTDTLRTASDDRMAYLTAGVQPGGNRFDFQTFAKNYPGMDERGLPQINTGISLLVPNAGPTATPATNVQATGPYTAPAQQSYGGSNSTTYGTGQYSGPSGGGSYGGGGGGTNYKDTTKVKNLPVF